MNLTDRASRALDHTGSAFLGLVALLTFLEASLRYFFALQIPDWFAFACLAQGIAMLWGIASTTYEGKHIVVDALWEAAGPRARRAIDTFAEAFTAAFFVLFAWMLAQKVLATRAANDTTTELLIPLWPFQLVAWIGIVLAAVLAIVRLARIVRVVRTARTGRTVRTVLDH